MVAATHHTSGSPTDAFFAALEARGHEPLVKSASGSVRFDIRDGERVAHWHVTMKKGDLTVAHQKLDADAVVRLDKETFDGMSTGTINAMAAALRGDLVPEGDLGLVLLFQRLFPAPPATGRRSEG